MFLIRKQKGRKGVGSVYIVNLCTSDIFVGIAMIILKIMTQFQKTTLKDDEVAKEFYNIIRYCVIRISLFVSVFNLSALTIDRLFAIKFPFIHRKQGKKFAFKICIGVWALSVVLCSIVYCVTRFYLNNIGRYNNLVFPIATYSASIIFIISYTIIFIEMRKSSKNVGAGSRKGTKAASEQDKAEYRFLKLAIKTVTVFMICWIPFSTCSLHMAITGTCGGRSVEYSLFTLAYMNSVINPFIYLTHAQKAISQKMNKMIQFFIPKKEETIEKNLSSAVTKDTTVAMATGNEAA
uniref:G-protein coupled receptors family 1 profile domain-containing protein n=2 Tax=Clytia hemisphaerica TaxID=252671 RepID=A0A7M5WKD4_9CNID